MLKTKSNLIKILSLAFCLSIFPASASHESADHSHKAAKHSNGQGSKTGIQSSLLAKWSSKVSDEERGDFSYPSHDPSIVSGEIVYEQHCSMCHGVGKPTYPAKDYMRKQSPEQQFIKISNGYKNMPAFKNKLSRDERWDALMYFRTQVLGYYPLNSAELAEMNSIFGGNCAVCHGTRGHGDGNLHKQLYPPPANFNMFERLYTRTDEKLFNELKHGIPWTAMPAWYNRYDYDRRVSFDEKMIWKLVRYVRQFGHSQEIDRLDKGRMKLEEYKSSLGK